MNEFWHKVRRAVSVLLAVALVVTTTPLGAFADNGVVAAAQTPVSVSTAADEETAGEYLVSQNGMLVFNGDGTVAGSVTNSGTVEVNALVSFGGGLSNLATGTLNLNATGLNVTADALIERMREGKIYPKTRAKAALENFFRADNLSSLRELFMRRSADRIEKQVNHGERRTRILVLISPSPSSQKTIRVAARTAEAFHCKFSAMYVETNGALSDEAAANLKKHMNLVRDTGGEIIVKYSDDVVETVADYVRLAGVTHLILGKTWQSAGKKVGLEDKFIERLPNLEILIVPDNQRFYAKRAYRQTLFARLFNRNKLLQKYKTANRILDIAHLLERASLEESEKNKRQVQIAHILSRAFDRSVAILSVKGKSTAAVKGENVGFFGEGNETAVAEWCRKNHKAAGRGTDTLRESKAIYFPVTTNTETVVVAFSCMERKLTVTERLIFYQLENLLRMIL